MPNPDPNPNPNPRNMSSECLAIIGNAEVIALSQDPFVSRARLIYQSPDAKWPNWDYVPPNGTGYPVGPNGTSVVASPAVGGAPSSSSVFTRPNIVLQAWAKPLSDGSRGVVVMTRGGGSASMQLLWSVLGLLVGTRATVRDLWLHRDLGTFTGSVNVSVPPRDAAALKITPEHVSNLWS